VFIVQAISLLNTMFFQPGFCVQEMTGLYNMSVAPKDLTGLNRKPKSEKRSWPRRDVAWRDENSIGKETFRVAILAAQRQI